MVGTPPRAGCEQFAIGDRLDDGAKTPSTYGDAVGERCDDLVIPVWPINPALIGYEKLDAPESSDELCNASSVAMVSQPDPEQGDGRVGRVGNGSGGGPGSGSPPAGPHGRSSGYIAIKMGAEFIEKGFEANKMTQAEQLVEFIDMHVGADDELFSKVCSLRKWLAGILQLDNQPPIEPHVAGRPNDKGRRTRGKRK